MSDIQILSLGGGVDSSALLAMHLCREDAAEHLGITIDELNSKLPQYKYVVFADPGSEWPATYENIEYAKRLCEIAGLHFETVIYEQRYFRNHETNERITDTQWRQLSNDEKENWKESIERMTIFEWLTERPDGSGSLPMLPGTAHQCSDRFKGGIQRKWADNYFGKGVTKTWSLGIEANESKRHKRFTMNKGESKFPQHKFIYPLMDLNLTREDCKEVLRELRWDFRGDGSMVEKSSCMWCPWISDWEVDRLIGSEGEMHKGLEEALAIEKTFYEGIDKHIVWHENGMPRTNGSVVLRGTQGKDRVILKGGKEAWEQLPIEEMVKWKPPRAPKGMHAQPFQTGVCTHERCIAMGHNKHGKATLVQIRYKVEDGKMVQKSGKGSRRLTIEEHMTMFPEGH
jgi:hypothetical protein